MSLSYVVPRRFDPTRSLLGCAIRRRVRDARRAEACFIVGLAGVLLALILAQYLAWALLHETIRAGGTAGTIFWLAQPGLLLVCLGTCVLGFRPAIRITAGAGGLCVEQGGEVCRLAYAEIRGVETISALRFHRHERRYAATRAFVNRLEDPLLLIRTAEGPVVLGLRPADTLHLRDHLAVRVRVPAGETMRVA
ncbi:hypothetical protein GQ464_005975 [Rhodocaloribacter litoris]|uniref:hypothetical protein n=1 Tax=Rhodocaloribacter litoris TaxID=2558931 RepID=UPI001E376BC2|nr:hypothetical protein [Rhodocaloribacter litoris]QXD16494.1 hypothetical protein GQ464_005975 [Rhodocaloribacter litoris]